MDKIAKAQYKNLRERFQYLVDKVLGPNYYNHSNDVYSSDSECVAEIIAKFEELGVKVKVYRFIAIISSLTCIASAALILIAINQ